MTHPLTDEICDQITDELSIFSIEDCMRAAYDLAIEQVIEQWEEVMDSTMTDIQVIREFDKRLKAMRPQEDTP